MKKWDIQEIVFMIMLTRSSEKNFNPMQYTDNNNTTFVSNYMLMLKISRFKFFFPLLLAYHTKKQREDCYVRGWVTKTIGTQQWL